MPVLQDADLLGDLPGEVMHGLERAARARTYDPGQLIHSHGDAVDCLSLIRSGRIRFFRLGADGRRITVTELGAGAVYGLAPMLAGLDRSHDAEAVGETEILSVGLTALTRLMDRHVSLRDLLLRHLSSRLLQALALADDVQRLPLRQRLAQLLLASASGGRVMKPQADLAEELGVSRFAVGQTIKALAGEGAIRVVYGGIELVDPHILSEGGDAV